MAGLNRQIRIRCLLLRETEVILPDKDGMMCRRDIRIPLPEEYVRICQRYDKICVLELKNHFEKEDLIRMIHEIEQIEYLSNVIFISFNFENCVNVRKLLPDSKIQWLVCAEKYIPQMLFELI